MKSCCSVYLSTQHIKDIVKIQMQDVQRRLEDQQIQILLDETVVDWLAKKGFDPDYGARPLKRVIQKELLNPLANRIISGELKKGESVQVTTNDLHLILSVKKGNSDCLQVL